MSTVQPTQPPLQPFTTIAYVTKDGEKCTATKNNGIVTVQGDKNGVRQVPEEEFMKDLAENLPKVDLAGSPNKDTVNFKGKSEVGHVEEKDYQDHIERRTTVEATTGKKWGVGLGSAFLPGLGQFINGDIGKGIAFLGATFATSIGSFFALTKGAVKSGYALALASIPIAIWSIVDAVKNAKSTAITIEQKK